MPDFALGLHDDFLKRETERQNRIHQESKKIVEHTTNEKRMGGVRRTESRFNETVSQESTNSPASLESGSGFQYFPESQHRNMPHRSGRPLDHAPELMEESAYKVRHIPEIRSGLIPFDDATDGEQWSAAFSLPKADMEPWLSFLEGYYKSRLFLESTASQRNDFAQGKNEPLVDFSVRAILELKQISAKIILEPVIQIKGTADYLDLFAELRACNDPAREKSLIKTVSDIHASQLKKSVEKGREMGDQLYQALMGDGYANLVNAWKKIYHRKPTVEELHLMLTTGRLQMSFREQPQSAGVKEKLYQRKAGPSDETARQQQSPRTASVQKTVYSHMPETDVEKAKVTEQNSSDQKQTRSRKWKNFLYLLHASLCCIGLIAYGLMM